MSDQAAHSVGLIVGIVVGGWVLWRVFRWWES